MKNKKTRKIIQDFVKGNRFLLSFLLMILALIAIFLPQFILKLPAINKTQIGGIELVLYCSQIVSSIFVIAGTIIAVWQYYLSSSKRIKEKEFSRVEKAIELSNYYKDNILESYSFVKSVFECCGITEIIQSKRSNYELKEFDVIELHNIYTKEEIEKLDNLQSNKEFIGAIINMSSVHNFGVNGYVRNTDVSVENESMATKISANMDEVFSDFYKTYIVKTLNNAEYFAMSFTHKTADESVIYQSIYPTFLEMCFVMYYFIARYSDPATSKLYTNIAELYCSWRSKERKQVAEYHTNIRKGSKSPGTIISD